LEAFYNFSLFFPSLRLKGRARVGLFYGNNFLNTFIIDPNNAQALKDILDLAFEYLFAKNKVQSTALNEGSLTEVSAINSFSTGIQITTGSLKTSFAISTNPLIFDQAQTITAHSGNIPSFHIFLSSSLTKKSISSYLA
jgi:hypothetical protein